MNIIRFQLYMIIMAVFVLTPHLQSTEPQSSDNTDTECNHAYIKMPTIEQIKNLNKLIDHTRKTGDKKRAHALRDQGTLWLIKAGEHAAESQVFEQAVKHKLLDVSLDHQSQCGCTPLHHADSKGTKILLQYNVAVDKKNIMGDTPLNIACKNKNPRKAEQLIIAGANPFSPNNQNESPFDTCKKNYDSSTSYIQNSLKENKQENLLFSNTQPLSDTDSKNILLYSLYKDNQLQGAMKERSAWRNISLMMKNREIRPELLLAKYERS